MANYLVTGAAGFIGAAIAHRLLNEGHRVVTIDNLSTGYEENIPASVEFIHGDCGDPSICEMIPQYDYDAIIHVAGQSSGEVSFDDPIYDIRTNAESTLLLLKFAQKNGCNKFLYASTVSVYGVQSDCPVSENAICIPQSFYGVAKLASEHYLRIYQQHGINSTSLRLFNVYGAGQNLANLRQGMLSIYLAQMLDQKHIHVKGSAERFRDFVYIDDVVEAFMRCLVNDKCAGLSMNIGTGIRSTVAQVIDALLSTQENEVTVEYYGNTLGDVHGIYADPSLMNELLGNWDKTDLKTGIASMLDYITNSEGAHK